MRFSKYAITALLLAALAGLGACSSAPTSEAPPGGDELAASADPAREAPPGLDLTAPESNPYLSQPDTAPAAAKAAFATAVEAMQAERWLDAQRMLEQITRDYPALSGPFLNLGIVYRKLDQPQLAAQAFEQAISVNELNLEAYNQLAVLRREAGDFAAAEQHYLAALQVWPRHVPSHRNLAILYDLYMGKLDQALQHFEICQYLQTEEDRELSGWIIDLKRRIADAAGEQ